MAGKRSSTLFAVCRVTVFCIAASFVFLASSWSANGQTHSTAYTAKGQKIFKANCTMCHDDDGTASGPTGKALGAANLTSPAIRKESNEALAHFISAGKGKMPSFQTTLTQQQIADAVQYIRSLGNTGAAHR
ncbi:c-type cytochrome [Paracidobacterium acidisoli]|nr:cytochrome c [Paracidobacterium acidisoli]